MSNEEHQLPNEVSEDKEEIKDTRDTLVSPGSGRTIKKIKNEGQNGLIMPASPPTFVSMDQLSEAANAFYNMSLAHEITVDSHFMLEKYDPPEKSLEHTVKETMHRAFWDIIRSNLEADPPNYEPALSLLGEVKQSLSGLILPNQKTLEKLLDNCLDLDVARAQLEETGRLSLETYAVQVIGIMKQFCAPFRDREVAALEAITDPVEAFREAFALLEKMHMDLANFTIMQMRPYIRKQAAQYERTQFATFLATQKKIGIDGLLRTRRWIQEAYLQISKQQRTESATSETDLEEVNSAVHIQATQDPVAHPSTSAGTAKPVEPTPSNILLEAYLNLLTWPIGLDWPETMVMDQQRLTDIGLQLSKIVTLTSLVLVVCNCVVHKAALLFPVPVVHSVQTQVLLDLKRAVFRGSSGLLDCASLGNLPQKANEVADHLLSVVEHWYNSVYSVCQSPSSISTEREDIGIATSLSPPKILPDVIRCEIETQAISILNCQHPVHRLMQSRAITFLRSALSSYPPDSLSLPPGFGILTEMTKSTGKSASIPSTLSTNCLHPSSSSCLPTMASGIRSVRDPPSRDMEENEETVSSKGHHLSEGQASYSSGSLSLIDVAGRLMPLLAHNRHVFGAQYAEIIQSLLFPQTSSTSELKRPNKGNDTADDNKEHESTFAMSN